MKQRGKNIVAINIDSAHIKTLLGSFDEPTERSDLFFELQGAVTRTRGISKKGVITNRNNLAQAIGRSLENLMSFSGYEIDEVALSYTHPNIQFIKKTVGVQHIKSKDGIYITEKWLEIQEEKIKHKINSTYKHKRCAYFEIVSLCIDGEEVIYDPYEFTATESLYITYVCLLVPMAFIGTLLESVEQFTMVRMLQPTAALNGSLLSDEQKEEGVILCDIGPELTNVTIYKNGAMQGARVFLFGDNTITTELALLKKISLEEAEQIKSALRGDKSPLKKREMQSIDKKIGLLFKNDLLPYIKEIDSEKRFPHGIMLLGKRSQYPNIEKVIEKVTGLHTFHTKPTYHVQSQQHAPQGMWHTAYATLYSIVTQQEGAALYRKKTSFFEKIASYIHIITKILR